MKKILALCLCTGMAVTFCGCSLGNIVEQFTSTGDLSAGETSPAEALQEVKTRVYMDEISGKLEGFTGNTLTLSADKNTYCFDISQASLECKNGIITGDEISVIYEGQLTDTDTSTVKALKVVDEFHKKTKLKVQTVQGTLQNLTSNTITIKSGKGKALTYPITGTEQYYQNGLKAGNQVFLKYKGKDPSDKKAVDSSLDAGHLKVLSISDMKEFKAQKASPMPTPGAEDPTVSKQFLATVQDIKLNILEVIPAGKVSCKV